MAEQTEVWKPIPGYEGLYEVSNRGRVKRIAAGQGAVVGRILVTPPGKQGYLAVGLRFPATISKTYKVHRLVCSAFLGKCPEGHEVNHKNGIKHDNRISNLEYVTPKQNTQHSIQQLGRTAPRGEQHGRAVLTELDVIKIRSVDLTFTSAKMVAEQYGVAANTIWKAYKKLSWRHI